MIRDSKRKLINPPQRELINYGIWIWSAKIIKIEKNFISNLEGLGKLVSGIHVFGIAFNFRILSNEINKI